MYTRCPKCSTCFRVTDRHLAVAKGKVRCGQCQLVFNAPEHAIDDLPVNPATAQTEHNPDVTDPVTQTKKTKTPLAPTQAEKEHKAKAKKDQIEKTSQAAEIKKPPASTTKKPVTADPVFNPDATLAVDNLNKDELKKIEPATPSVTPDATNKNDDVFDENFDLDAAINELTQATEDSYKFENKENITVTTEEATSEKYIPAENSSKDIFETDAYTKTDASSVADIMNEMEGQLSLNIDDPNSNEKYDANDEFEFIELENEVDAEVHEQDPAESNDETLKKHFNFDEESEETEPESKQSNDDLVNKDEIFEPVDETDFQDSEVENTIISEDNSEDSADADVPFKLRGDIERLQAPVQRRLHPLLKFSFILVLLVLSFSQLAYFRAHEFVNLVPSATPYLEAFCEKVHCRYSGPRDTKQVELMSRDVRLHPKDKKALLISAAMINNANFAQPYPDIHIRLSDISGNIVAERIFNSKTYMGKLSSPFLLMKSKTPVHINFEVVDPGRDAINFEFTFL